MLLFTVTTYTVPPLFCPQPKRKFRLTKFRQGEKRNADESVHKREDKYQIGDESQHFADCRGDVVDSGPRPTTSSVDGSATGIATLVGQFSFSYQLTVNLANGTSTGSARLIAANGDSVFTTIAGSSELTATPGVLGITEINTITGGTGRFAAAQGSFTVERLVNLVTGFTSGSFHGTITSPGAAH